MFHNRANASASPGFLYQAENRKKSLHEIITSRQRKITVLTVNDTEPRCEGRQFLCPITHLCPGLNASIVSLEFHI